jgi:hydrogenase maturation factor
MILNLKKWLGMRKYIYNVPPEDVQDFREVGVGKVEVKEVDILLSKLLDDKASWEAVDVHSIGHLRHKRLRLLVMKKWKREYLLKEGTGFIERISEENAKKSLDLFRSLTDEDSFKSVIGSMRYEVGDEDIL